MKTTYILIISAIIAIATGQTAGLGTTSDDAAAGDLLDVPRPGQLGAPVAKPGSMDNSRSSSSSSSSPSPSSSSISENRFMAYSSPGLKGHKQIKNLTPGCYSLDGGAVGSFCGDKKSTYVFHSDSHCKGKVNFHSSYAPVDRIDPIIYPQSVKIRKLNHDDDDDDDRRWPPGGRRPPGQRYALVAYRREYFGGAMQRVRFTGCRRLSGEAIRSFRGRYRYRFHRDGNCRSPPILTSRGGQPKIRAIYPYSVYII